MQPTEPIPIFRARKVRRSFDRAAAEFDHFDFVHTVTRDGLLARLEPMVVDAGTVVDLACATGTALKPLAKRFRGARLIAVDLSQNMLRRARGRRSWFSRRTFLQANARALPLADQSVDVVFCNQLLPWVEDVASVFSEVSRVLRENGLFLFASLGPDSFSELRRAWQSVDAAAHVNLFPDMHNLGDAAVRAGLRDPVLDIDRLAVTYTDSAALFRDLTGSGARNCRADRALSLTGKDRFRRMTAALEQQRKDGVIELNLELVYGHCWGSGPRARSGEIHIAPERIGRRS
jgi:malonyl-CoA O-methyltransferase